MTCQMVGGSREVGVDLYNKQHDEHCTIYTVNNTLELLTYFNIIIFSVLDDSLL